MIRGELWWADYGVPFGSEPGYTRPVIVVQNDYFNNSKINTTIVIPFGVIDKQRLTEKITKVNRDIMNKIENSILFVFGIKII